MDEFFKLCDTLNMINGGYAGELKLSSHICDVQNNSVEKIKDEYYSQFSNIEIEDSNIICFKCNSSKVISQTKQLRSSDEGETLIAFCTKCKNKWKIN
jgi:DNA-directed RNA polymerase subunit M/transcription elongation factor TFIIS